MSPETTGHLV